MALSGSFNTTKYSTSSHGTLGLNVSWTATQNIANNTSTIKWTVKSNGTMSSGYYVHAGPVTVTINGTKVLNTTSRFSMYGDGKYKKTGSITIAHNTDGTKSVSMSVRAAIYSASVNCTGSHTYTLDTINRYALIASATDFTNESYPTVVYTNPAGTSLTTGLEARLVWKDVNDVDQYSSWVTLNDEGGEYTFDSTTLTAENITSMLNSCPNANFLSVKVDLQSTMDGVIYDDYKDIVMNVVNANPSFTVSPSYEDSNDDVYDITGDRSVIVQSQSKLRIYAGTASAQKGASMLASPYSLEFNGQTYSFEGNYIEFDKPNLAGAYVANITAVDTRGNSISSSISIAILAWSAPTAECSLERLNSFETNSELLVKATIASLDNINVLTIQEKHKKITDSAWSQLATIQNDSPTTIALANTSEWEMEVLVSDKFVTVVYRLTVGKGIPYIYKDFKRNSFAFNSIPDDDDQFKIGGHLKVKPNDTDAGVKLPHAYSTTEQVVGYWLDGSPIYEKTIEFQSAVTINANSWSNNVYTNDEDITVLNGEAYYYNSNFSVYVYWGFMAIQSSTTDKTKVNLYNSRDSSCQVSILIIRYIKPTQNNS